jgi:predicted secreted protein
MAQTTGVMNGTLMAVYVATTEGSEVLVAHATSCSFDFTHDPRDTTTKQSAGFTEKLEGLRSGTLSCEALYAEDASVGLDELWAAGRTPVFLVFSPTENVGDTRIRFAGVVTSLSISSGVEDNVSYSASFDSSGVITREIIT